MDANTYIGRTIAERFEILSIAGSGGMGTVFKAKQADLDRIVALKVLDPSLISDDDSLKRFEREAKSLSLLANRHIASFYSYGVLDNAMPFIVMEYVEGQSLAALLEQQGVLTVERTVRIALQVCEALGLAHQAGVIHRDLKPQNILLVNNPEPDYVKVVDFGLSYVGSNDGVSAHLTKTGMLMGTPHYLSPEQCLGRRADARSDVYSLGCIIYQMICGVPPFDSDHAIALIQMHVNEEAPSLARKMKQHLNSGIAMLVMTCLAKQPEKRYQSMEELAVDLQNVASGELPDVQRKAEMAERSVRSAQAGIALRILLAVLVVSSCGFMAYNLWQQNDLSLSERCHKSLETQWTAENLSSWMKQAIELSKAGKPGESESILSELERASGVEGSTGIDAAVPKFELARTLFDTGEFSFARRLAIAAFLDLNRAIKEHKLSGKGAEIADRVSAFVRKLKRKNTIPAGANNEATLVEPARAAMILSVDTLVLRKKIEYANILTSKAAKQLAQVRQRKRRLDAETLAYVQCLLEAYETKPFDDIPYAERVKVNNRGEFAALDLAIAAQFPADEVEEKFFSRKQSAARTYIAICGDKAAEKYLSEILAESEKDSEPYNWARSRLAAIENKRGDSRRLNQLEKEMASYMIPADLAVFVSISQEWVADYAGGEKTLKKALAELDPNAPGRAEAEAAIYRSLSSLYGDSGEYDKEEVTLRHCLELMSDSKLGTPSDRYNVGYYQMTRQYVDCLRKLHRDKEADAFSETNSITGAEQLTRR